MINAYTLRNQLYNKIENKTIIFYSIDKIY